MEFKYAKELKEIFDVYGHFYDLKIGEEIFNCRSTLEIIDQKIEYKQKGLPDAVVVMMNPGSSRPLDRDYEPKLFNVTELYSNKIEKDVIPTRPDNAQYQIMRLMLFKKWRYVKVLNLSDLRNGNSSNFSKEFHRAQGIDKSNPHCITHTKRRIELGVETKTKSGGPVIAAWGSNTTQKNEAIEMTGLFPGITGVKLAHPWYKYPSPYIKEQKLLWLREILEILQRAV